MTAIRITHYYEILTKHKVVLSTIMIGTVVVLGGLLVFGRSNKQVQAAPPPLEVGVISMR